MDSFEINNIKLGKANAMMKHRQYQKMAKLFRIIEISVILVLLSRFSSQLPLAVKNSGEYFKELMIFLVSPRFVFILGNAIVGILFAKSGQFSTQDSAGKDSCNDLYKEFIDKSTKTQNIHRYEVGDTEKQSLCTEKVVSDLAHTSCEIKSYRRSQSENLKRVSFDKSCRELRRSGTEMYSKNTNSGGKLVNNSYPEDEMSNEEFRNKIEAFIARQQKFRMEEEYYMN
ncbi:tRNA-methyltransferase non-catalytic subunit trm6MTase subunit [Melia azedarach]|uniref:tRNA-methyltransferase non-catalytic subunit trm6MTase subunit n=1 Tax=Melia azedarach TaxID=155640 RepID=A0ACC1Y027_MELAZ|nr:tRNA-methyltransferase non-catalytic subunit trm6MTase subunit [Melia azedarach]